jgi:hypothetical protein
MVETGRKKPKTNRGGDPNRSLVGDRCQTPPYAVTPLLPYLTPEWTIWESAAGEGLLAQALRDAGFTVVETDILTGQNFFVIDPPAGVTAQVTNPPYNTRAKYRWIEHSYHLYRMYQLPFALLMSVETLGSKTAQSFFREYGVEVIFLDDRVDFKMPEKGWFGDGAQFPVAWFTCGLNIGQGMTFARMNKPSKQRRDELAHGVIQHTLLDDEEDCQLSLFGANHET